MTARRPAAGALALLCALTAAGCGDTVGRDELERKIATFVRDQTGTSVTVHCPEAVRARKGTRTTCETELSGVRTLLDVTFTTDTRFRVSPRLTPS